MAILINDTSPRAQYTATSGQTVFSVPFEFFSNSDLVVYQNTTIKTLTTHYTVTGAGVTGGGSITLVTGATAGDVITIVRDIPVKRVTDFPTSGPFNVDALNTELDRLTAMIREREDQVTRVISIAATDPAANLYLPVVAQRAGKVLAFDSSGNPTVAATVGTYVGLWDDGVTYNYRDLVKDPDNSNIYFCNTGHTSTGVAPIMTNADSAKWDLVVDAASAAASEAAAAASATAASSSASSASSSASSASSSASSASTSASNASTSATSAAASATAAAASYDSFDDRYLGAKSSAPTLDNDGNALIMGALYFNSTTKFMYYYTGTSWDAIGDTVNGTANRYNYVATAGQTSFAATYEVSYVDVYRNGVKLVRTTDYTDTSGTAIVLATGATVGDTIDIVGYGTFNVAIIPAANITGTVAVGNGGSGATTLTGILKGNGTSAFSAATAGTDYVAPATATTFSATQSFSGSSTAKALSTKNIVENTTVSATAATGTVTLDPTVQSVLYYTSNASAGFTVDINPASTSMDALMAVGDTMTVVFMVTNGTTAYYAGQSPQSNAVVLDGSATGVTTKWQGGTAPSSGNASAIDVYTFTVIKTASATFTILASQTKFA